MSSPEFEALSREAGIAASSIAQGVAAINRANYAHKGYYHSAFFNLSIAIERLAKLIFIFDHSLTLRSFPTDNDLRSLGHKITVLVEKAQEIRDRRGLDADPLPDDPITVGIIETLSEFATATRYYNLDYLVGGRSAAMIEPLAAWSTRVVNPILTRHYRPARQAKDQAQAEAIGALMDRYSMVRHTAEDGSPITSWTAGATESAKIPTIQKYSRMYVLQIVRFLSTNLDELNFAALTEGFDVPHMGDFFGIFRNDDAYFLRRKSWDPFNP